MAAHNIVQPVSLNDFPDNFTAFNSFQADTRALKRKAWKQLASEEGMLIVLIVRFRCDRF